MICIPQAAAFLRSGLISACAQDFSPLLSLMNLHRISLLAIALTILPFTAIHGQDGYGRQQADPDANLGGQVLCRVEALMVAMPEKAALLIMPELQQKETIKAGMAKLLKAVKDKTAILTGNPMIESQSGQRCISESIVEERYLIMTDPTPEKTVNRDGAEARSDQTNAKAQPGFDFETRSVGVTLECEGQIGPNGKVLDLNVVAQRTTLLGYHMVEARLREGGEMLQIPQPRFECLKTTTSLSFRSGESRLMAVHKPQSHEGYIEFVVITGSIVPIGK